MSFLGAFRQSAEIDIALDGADTRRLAEIRTEDGKKERHYLYYDGESVSGKVNITLRKPGVKLEHHGIRIELVGEIELYQDRGNHHEFTSLVKDLARPGELVQNTSYTFEFHNVEKPYESYTGSNVRLRYYLRVTVVRRLTDLVKECELIVHTLSSYPDVNSPIKMEVGIEDCLHIEFEYNKSKYHLKDVIVGKIYFLLVRIKIKHMEIAIIKRESTGIGQNTFNDNETIAKYEIMDGAPVRGESIPIRLFLAGYDLTPTMKDINKKFSVRYYLNLVLVDEEERRYFKQQEIVLWRRGERLRRTAPSHNATASYNPTTVPAGIIQHHLPSAIHNNAVSSTTAIVPPTQRVDPIQAGGGVPPPVEVKQQQQPQKSEAAPQEESETPEKSNGDLNSPLSPDPTVDGKQEFERSNSVDTSPDHLRKNSFGTDSPHGEDGEVQPAAAARIQDGGDQQDQDGVGSGDVESSSKKPSVPPKPKTRTTSSSSATSQPAATAVEEES